MVQKIVPVLDPTDRADGKVLAWSAAASSHVYADAGVLPTLGSARYIRSSGDYTTTSTSVVDVDGTNLALTITTGARRVMVGFVGTVSHTNGGSQIYFDVAVDGTDQGQTSGPVFGLHGTRIVTNGYIAAVGFTYLTDVLSAGSHTFKLRWATTGATATLQGGSTNRAFMEFWVQEMP